MSFAAVEFQHQVDLLEVALFSVLPAEGLGHYKARAEYDLFARRFVASLRGYIAAGRPQEIPAVVGPDGWWQHLKLELGQRFPRLRLKVRDRVLRPAAKFHARVCPHIRQEHARCLTFLTADLGSFEFEVARLRRENEMLRAELDQPWRPRR